MQAVERRIHEKIERRFNELRDELLAASNELAKSENRDWGQAERLFAASKNVDEICRNILTTVGDDATNRISSGINVGGAEALPSADRKSRKKSKKDYPKYAVGSGALSKIGLSRDRRTEYEHTVPRAEFDAVMKRLGELVGRKHFNADDVIDQVSCPSYQTYIVISLLKDRGLLAAPRRGVYAFARPKDFLNEAAKIWGSLELGQVQRPA